MDFYHQDQLLQAFRNDGYPPEMIEAMCGPIVLAEHEFRPLFRETLPKRLKKSQVLLEFLLKHIKAGKFFNLTHVFDSIRKQS